MGIGVPDPQRFEVTVREYGTEAPIAGAIVELAEYSPCRGDGQVCPPVHRSLRTGSDGVMRVTIPHQIFGIERISAPGYLTQCPVLGGTDPHHLTDDSKKELGDGIFLDHTTYLCHLVSPSALVVRDRATAIDVAKTAPEIASWLREHRDAKPGYVERVGIHWEVRFEKPALAYYVRQQVVQDDSGEYRLVVVDGLDRTTSVRGRWE